MAEPAARPPAVGKVSTSIRITVRIQPGVWIMGLWSIVRVEFEIYIGQGNSWMTHLSPSNFKGVRKPDSYRGQHHTVMGSWSRTPVYPGFTPRIEDVPQVVLDALEAAYLKLPMLPVMNLPPMDATSGKGPVR